MRANGERPKQEEVQKEREKEYRQGDGNEGRRETEGVQERVRQLLDQRDRQLKAGLEVTYSSAFP